MTSCPRCRRTYEDGVRFCPVDGAQVTAAMQDANLGRVLMGQFELREIAGRGAMGTVYRAYQRTMDRIVAVKILRAEIVKEPGVLRRFLREARAAARLQHPNIVTVHMVGETEDGVPYLVMEHIDGVSLEAICEAQGPQPLPRVVSFGKQIASALSEAHSLGIVHRDLKPANILVTDRSRTPDLVKVLDFGIAKLITTEADQSMMTADGTIFGTPHYIAPEQASSGDVDHRVDLYSLGCILFRLTTGALPFEGTASMQVVLKHLRDEPPRPSSLVPGIPEALESLILQCLAKRREERPADADEVIAALERVEREANRAKESQRMAALARAAGPSGAAPRVATPSTSGPRATTPPGGSARVATPPTGTAKLNSTGKIAAMKRSSPWANRTVWVGVFLAATIGASVGVLAALTHNSAEESVPPAPEHPALPRTARAWVEEEPALTSSSPTVASPATASVTPAADTTLKPTTNAATIRPATTAPATAATAPAEARQPVKTARAEPPPPVRRRARHDKDDMPVTVVPPDPEPKVVAHPLPVTAPATAAPPATTSPPAAAPPATTAPATSAPPASAPPAPASSAPPPSSSPPASASPPAASSPSERPPRDDEPPPAPPPPANDPTTVPLPTPAN